MGYELTEARLLQQKYFRDKGCIARANGLLNHLVAVGQLTRADVTVVQNALADRVIQLEKTYIIQRDMLLTKNKSK